LKMRPKKSGAKGEEAEITSAEADAIGKLRAAGILHVSDRELVWSSFRDAVCQSFKLSGPRSPIGRRRPTAGRGIFEANFFGG